MGATATYRRATAALDYTLPSGAAFLFTPESLQHSGGWVTGWRNEVDNSVLSVTGSIPYIAADAELNNLPSAEIGQTFHFD